MSASRRRGDVNPKLHMDRQPTVARITDPSLPAGKRREIDNVMKKARANTNDYWDKKLIEVEEKDPNRWRHTGYKKMYIQRESSSVDSERQSGYRYNSSGAAVGGVSGRPPSSSRYGRSRSPRSRSHSRLRKSPLSPPMHRRSPHVMDAHSRRMSPPSPMRDTSRGRPLSPPPRGGMKTRSPDVARRPLGVGGVRPRSPPEPPMRRKVSRSPISRRRMSPVGNVLPPGGTRRSPPISASSLPPNKRAQILPRSKRPPSPPPRNSCRSRTNSSASSCSDDSCSMCTRKPSRRSRSLSHMRGSGGPRSPPPKASRSMQYRNGPTVHGRPLSPPSSRLHDKYRENKIRRVSRDRSTDNRVSADRHLKVARPGRHSPTEESRLKTRPPEPPEPASSSSSTTAVPKKKKKDKEKGKEKELRTRIKIEGEKRKKHSNTSSESDDSGGSDSESSLPTFTATTRLTLSERFGKMAQWSIDRSNMENMRITKDSAGGALKVMIEEGLESPPRRYSYSPAPVGHFPEELATTAPSGMLSWDDVRVRYEYYKSRGYLRDLDLKDYIKWEEWWYKYQEWLKQERYYEYWERQQLQRRRRKKLPITQRLN